MASLVEFDPAVHPRLNDLRIPAQLEYIYETSNITRIWRKFDTPPLSPDPESVEEEEHDSDSAVAEDPLLNELLQCEQLLAYEEECSSDSQNSQTTELLVEDCMWNSESYAPRNSLSGTGVYTPAPSPPPSPIAKELIEAMVEVSQSLQPECVNPSSVFPALIPPEEANQKQGRRVRERSEKRPPLPPTSTATTTSCLPRLHLQALPSESEEEIDVVTVIERPKMNTRKRLVSLSAPCSRQTSPIPSPVKKRRYHTKRLQRLSSVGSNVELAESDDEQKRASHNVLERKRRNDLKYSFQVLRSQVPELEDNQRAPKVMILRKAANFILRMQEQEQRLEMELRREQSRKAKLMERLAYLKSLSPY